MNKKHFSIGLKLWSTNENYIQEAKRLFSEGVCQYIELYVVPDSFDKYSSLWLDLKNKLNIPFVIHAPHYGHGMNLAVKEKELSNAPMIAETKRFADALGVEIIIYHPGIQGDIHETVRQFQNMNDRRVVVENKPYIPVIGDAVCNGYSPEDINLVMEQADVGFCLDIGHAICAANSLNEPPLEYLKRFIALAPTMYHLTDGHYEESTDSHMHFDQGTFPLQDIIRLFPSKCMVTNEAIKDSTDNLNDFVEDIERLRQYV
jgi:endonuclease IV